MSGRFFPEKNSGKYWRGGQKRRGRGPGDYNVNESRHESFLPKMKEEPPRQDRDTSEESSRGRSSASRVKKPRSEERKEYLLRDSLSPDLNNSRDHISRKSAHYREMGWEESDEENEEASRGMEKVSPHSLPSTSGSSEMGVEESQSPSPAPLPEQTLLKLAPMKEEPMEEMEDASNVPSTPGMATLKVERLIKEERVEEAPYAPPQPPRPFDWTPYPPVPFSESRNVNLEDISDQEDEMEDATSAPEEIEEEERDDGRESEEAETPVLDAEPVEENHPEEEEVRDEEEDVVVVKIVKRIPEKLQNDGRAHGLPEKQGRVRKGWGRRNENVQNDLLPHRQQPPPPPQRSAPARSASLPRKTIIPREPRDYSYEDDNRVAEENERRQRELAKLRLDEIRKEAIRKHEEEVPRQPREAFTPEGTPPPLEDEEEELVGAGGMEERLREVHLDEVEPQEMQGPEEEDEHEEEEIVEVATEARLSPPPAELPGEDVPVDGDDEDEVEPVEEEDDVKVVEMEDDKEEEKADSEDGGLEMDLEVLGEPNAEEEEKNEKEDEEGEAVVVANGPEDAEDAATGEEKDEENGEGEEVGGDEAEALVEKKGGEEEHKEDERVKEKFKDVKTMDLPAVKEETRVLKLRLAELQERERELNRKGAPPPKKARLSTPPPAVSPPAQAPLPPAVAARSPTPPARAPQVAVSTQRPHRQIRPTVRYDPSPAPAQATRRARATRRTPATPQAQAAPQAPGSGRPQRPKKRPARLND